MQYYAVVCKSGDLWERRRMESLMTLVEVAEYLRLSKDSVYRMAQKGKIPASKVGTQWRFRRKDVDEWLERNKNVTSAGGTDVAEQR